MKTITIDFASSNLLRSCYRVSRWTWLFFVVGLVICIAGISSVIHQNTLINHEIQVLSSDNASLENRQTARPKIVRKAITELQANAVNEAIAQLNLPWNDLFSAVEAATPQSIALLSLEPDAHRSAVRGIAEAKDSEAMVHYVEQLKHQPFFKGVFIVMHDINQLDPNKPMRFEFEAYWQEPTP